MTDEPLRPDAVEQVGDEKEKEEEGNGPAISQPNKLIRIASMTRAMLDEVRQAPVDERSRNRLAEVHRQSIEELRGILSDELLEEFDQIMVPLNTDDTTDSEVRIAQAQLIGWLEGLFHGIQASLWTQQMAAQAQVAEMQRRALKPGSQQQQQQRDPGSGLYL